MVTRRLSACCFWLLSVVVSAGAATFDYTTLWAHLCDTEVTRFTYDSGGLVDVAVKGNFAYSIDDYYGLRTVDCTDPMDTVIRGRALLYSSPRRCDVWDHFVYVIDGLHRINVIDVDDHDDPVLINQVDVGESMNDVLVVGPWLYIAMGNGSVGIYSLAAASTPTLVNTLILPPQHSERLVLDGDRVVAAGDAGIAVINAAIPDWPSIAGSHGFDGNTWDLSVRNGLAVVGQTDQSRILDISDPTAITETFLLPDTGEGVHLTSNGQVWLGWEACWHYGGMRIYDISDPAEPVWLHDEIDGFRGAPRAMVEYQGLVYAAEHMCWCAGEWPGFHVFQVGDLPLPDPLATRTDDGGLGMLRHGTRVDLATREGIVSLDLSDPSDPQLVQVLDPDHTYFDPVEDDGVIACVRDLFWLQMFSRDAGGSLTLRGEVILSYITPPLAISGSLVLATVDDDGGGGLWALDVSDPDAPFALERLFDGETIHSIALHGELAAVGMSGTSNIYDLTNLANPVMLSAWPEDAYWRRNHQRFVERSGGLYLMASYDGSPAFYNGGYGQVFNVTDPTAPTSVFTLRQLAMDRVGPLTLRDDLLVVPGTNHVTFYTWPDANGPAEFQGRIPLPDCDSYWGTTTAIVTDQAIVTQQPDGQLCTWPLPAGTLTGAPDAGRASAPDALSAVAFPNPFNPTCEIHFALATDGETIVDIFDTRGRLVRSLLQASVLAGRHTVRWDGRDGTGRAVAAGVYLARVRSGQHATSIKLTLTK